LRKSAGILAEALVTIN